MSLDAKSLYPTLFKEFCMKTKLLCVIRHNKRLVIISGVIINGFYCSNVCNETIIIYKSVKSLTPCSIDGVVVELDRAIVWLHRFSKSNCGFILNFISVHISSIFQHYQFSSLVVNN